MFNCKLRKELNQSKQHAADNSDDVTRVITTTAVTLLKNYTTSGAFAEETNFIEIDKNLVHSEYFLYIATEVN